MSAKPQRQMRLLRRLGLHRNIVKVPMAGVKSRPGLGPEELHDLHGFAEARHPALAHVTENIFMRAEMTAAESDAHNRATAAHHIERGVRFRKLHRVAQRQENHRRAQFYFRRERCDVTEERHRLEHNEVADDPLLKPQAFEAKRFGAHRELADVVHIRRAVEENLRQLDAAREVIRHDVSAAPYAEELFTTKDTKITKLG